MRLPVDQQRALGRIEAGLLSGDPRLESLFAIFTRLARPDPMPRTEQVRDGRQRLLHPAMIIPITLVIALLGVLLVSTLAPGGQACAATHARIERGQPARCGPGPAVRPGWPYFR